MQVDLNRIVSNPLGRLVYHLARPFVNFMRRSAHPDIPTSHVISKVRCGDRRLSIEHRRWSQDDALAIKQCFEQQQYNMPTGLHGKAVTRIYQSILASGRQPLILDCGANIGASVVWLADRYPEAHIVAIEPAPENFALLRRNTIGLDADLREAGIAPQDGDAFLKSCGGDMGYQTTDRAEGIAIQMLSVATLLAEKSPEHYVPFLLKIDIEGAEASLFSGDTTAINQFPLIILEPHDWMLPGKLPSQPFLRFHVASSREFCLNNENIASIAVRADPPNLTQ